MRHKNRTKQFDTHEGCGMNLLNSNEIHILALERKVSSRPSDSIVRKRLLEQILAPLEQKGPFNFAGVPV